LVPNAVTASLASSKVKKIYVMDLRGHGRSVCEVIPDRENFPDMMVRLAVDLQEFLVSLDEKSEAPRMCVVGSSMGAAILWNYFDMFSYRNYPFITSAVFVDQAPLQYEKEDWQLGSKGMRNPSDLTNLQHLLKSDMKEFAAGNAKCCLVSPGTLDQEYIEQITKETLRCDPHFLGELMADHTRVCIIGSSSSLFLLPLPPNIDIFLSFVLQFLPAFFISSLTGVRCWRESGLLLFRFSTWLVGNRTFFPSMVCER